MGNINIIIGNITKLEVNAIVNAANHSLLAEVENFNNIRK